MKLDVTKTNGSSPRTNHQSNSAAMNVPLYPEQELDREKRLRDQNIARIMGAIPDRPQRLRVAAELLLRGESLTFIGRQLGITRERVRQYFLRLPKEIRQQWELHLRLRREQRRVQPPRIPVLSPDGRHRPEYQCFRNMLQRCLNPRHPNYPNYGGRGVRVCHNWNPDVVGPRDAFLNFFRDMGERPQATKNGRAVYSIHRKDNALLYSKETCKWATGREQCGPDQRRARHRETKEAVRFLHS